MNQMVVVFHLQGTAFNVVMEEHKAKQLLQDWLSGALGLRDNVRLGETDVPGPWAICIRDITGIQIGAYQPPTQQSPGRGIGRLGPGTSGLMN